MTINAPASLLLLLYELVAEGRGVQGTELRGTVQNDILKEYVARGNYIYPPGPSMRIDRPLRVRARRLPKWNARSRSPATTSARRARRRCRSSRSRSQSRIAPPRGGGCGRALAGRVRRAPLVLLQRAQPLLPGRGREVPRGAASLGVDHGRPLRRDEPEGAGASVPHADRPGRPSRPSSRRTTSCASRCRRSPPSPAVRNRSARTPTTRRSRSRPGALGADRLARGRSSRTRPAARTTDPLGNAFFVEELTGKLKQARELIERIDDLGGAVAAIEADVQREIEAPRRVQARAPAQGGGRTRRRRRQPLREADDEETELHRLDPESERRQGRAHRPYARRARRRYGGARARLGAGGGASAGNLLVPIRGALAAKCTVGEICNVLREEFGTYDAHLAR